jgi:hypothetical protein
MSWHAPRNWVTSEIVTAVEMNEQIRDNELVLHEPLVSLIPLPVEPIVGASAGVALAANNTTAHLGVVYIPRPLTLDFIQYNVSGASGGAPSVVRIALYTEDGQTQIFNVTDAVGANTGIRTVAMTDVAIEAGNYILFICHSTYDTSGKLITRFTYDTTLQTHVAAEPDLSGTLTIAGGAAPATIDPTAFTTVAGALIPEVRFFGNP